MYIHIFFKVEIKSPFIEKLRFIFTRKISPLPTK